MFSVLADGPRRHRLVEGAGADVGWIRGRAIGFRGFRNKADAITAASVGWRSLQTLLHREYASWPRQVVEWENLRFVHDGAHEWVSDGRIPLARLQRVPREVEDERTEGELAVEFVVPSWMDEGALIPIAHALRHVLTTRGNDNDPHDHHSHDDSTRHAQPVAWRHEEHAASASPDWRAAS